MVAEVGTSRPNLRHSLVATSRTATPSHRLDATALAVRRLQPTFGLWRSRRRSPASSASIVGTDGATAARTGRGCRVVHCASAHRNEGLGFDATRSLRQSHSVASNGLGESESRCVTRRLSCRAPVARISTHWGRSSIRRSRQTRTTFRRFDSTSRTDGLRETRPSRLRFGASFNCAPSGITPPSLKRHSAINSLRAKATIPILRSLGAPLPKRSRYQRLS